MPLGSRVEIEFDGYDNTFVGTVATESATGDRGGFMVRLDGDGGEWMLVPGHDRYRPVGAQANDAGLGARGARGAENKRQADTDANPGPRKK